MFMEITVELEVSDKTAAMEPLEPGDLYVAKRNTGFHLMHCKLMSSDGSCVVAEMTPRGRQPYTYDSHECRKVLSIRTGDNNGPLIDVKL